MNVLTLNVDRVHQTDLFLKASRPRSIDRFFSRRIGLLFRFFTNGKLLVLLLFSSVDLLLAC